MVLGKVGNGYCLVPSQEPVCERCHSFNVPRLFNVLWKFFRYFLCLSPYGYICYRFYLITEREETSWCGGLLNYTVSQLLSLLISMNMPSVLQIQHICCALSPFFHSVYFFLWASDQSFLLCKGIVLVDLVSFHQLLLLWV